MKVFCIEGEWASGITDRQSVEPLLAMLHEVEGVEYVHRRVGTRNELVRQLAKWRRHRSYDVLYLASHGERGALYLSDDEPGPVTTNELAELLEGHCASAYVLLSGCQTMLAGDNALASFIAQTGAEAITGYRTFVPWIPSAALDLLLLHAVHDNSALQRRQRGVTLLRRFTSANSELARATGFDWYVPEGRGRSLLAA